MAYDSQLESAVINAAQHTQGFTTSDGYSYLSTTTSSDGSVDNTTGFNYDAGFNSPRGNFAWWLGASGNSAEIYTHNYTTQTGDPAYVTDVQIAFTDLSNSFGSGIERMYVYINGERVDLLNDPRITLTNNADGDYTGSGDGGLTTLRGRSTAGVSGGALQANEIGYITINDPNGISSVSVQYVGTSDSNGFLYDIGTNPDAWYPPSGPCFADTVMIETADGLKAAGAIRSGDLVKTRDNGFQEVRWVGSHHVAGARMAEGSKLRPIRIRAGALGDNVPAADLLISPQHRVLVRSRVAQRMFGTDEVLVAAKQLLMLEGIDVATELDEVTYVHILFDDHQIIFSEGAETESLYTGEEALKGVGRDAREEIFALFPELRDAHEKAMAARHLATGRMARRLAMRHQQNRKPLVS